LRSIVQLTVELSFSIVHWHVGACFQFLGSRFFFSTGREVLWEREDGQDDAYVKWKFSGIVWRTIILYVSIF